MTLLEFTSLGHRFAVPVSTVRRVVPSAAPAPLPGAPPMVAGALNLGGEVVALVDLGRRFGLGSAPLTPAQRIVVLAIPGFLLGFAVDEVHGVSERDVAGDALPGEIASRIVPGMVVGEDGLAVLVDPEQVLLREDEARLRAALEAVHG